MSYDEKQRERRRQRKKERERDKDRESETERESDRERETERCWVCLLVLVFTTHHIMLAKLRDPIICRKCKLLCIYLKKSLTYFAMPRNCGSIAIIVPEVADD